jgi:prepilin-type N-terminal cleavage/methylation domain-containing protein
MTKTIKKSGFTLIELLIVIGLLAALAAVMLPNLMGDREKALQGIDAYNAAGTLRTLRQYQAVTGGQLPNGLHTGLQTSSGTALMAGLSSTFSNNLETADIVQLTQIEVDALKNIGITKLAYGTGDPQGHNEDGVFGYTSLTTASNVISITRHFDDDESNLWSNNEGTPMTFNGKGFHYLGHEGYTQIIPLFVAPTAEWIPKDSTWVKGFEVGMDVPPRSPVLSDAFPYFIAYIGLRGGFEITFSSQTGSGSVEHAHRWYSTLSEAQDALSDLLGDGAEEVGAEWDIAGTTWVSNDGITTGTVDYTAGSGGTPNNGSVVVTITDHSALEAVLLGTSTPNCTSMNP